MFVKPKISKWFLAAGILLSQVPPDSLADIKRSRAESMPGIFASNTEGFSNIWIGADAAFGVRDHELVFEPRFLGTVGLASLMHLSASTGLPKGRTLGTTELHAQITTPGNDNLRFFGIGASGDLLLSTAVDTSTNTPVFTPYIGFTGMLDLDLVKKFPWMPLKLYLNASNLGEEQSMMHLQVIRLQGTLEYKGNHRSYSMGGTLGIYKEKPDAAAASRGNPEPAYNSFLLYLHPGARFHIGERMSVIGQAKLLVGGKRESQYLPEQDLGVLVRWEMPLYFKDTNAEAIRALIFVDRQKKTIRQQASNRKKDAVSTLLAQPDSTGSTDEDRLLSQDYFKRKEELRKRREKALEEMKRIEEMLE